MVVLPSFCIGGVLNDLPVFSDDGEIIGEEKYLYSRSPLCFNFLVIQRFIFLMSGRLHRSELFFIYSRSPLSDPVLIGV